MIANALSGFTRQARIYIAFAAMVPKMFLAYSIWVWMEMFVLIVAFIILISFWTAVYASRADGSLSGLSLSQTLNYIILAQLFLPAAQETNNIGYLGYLLRNGQMGIELLRPVDFQLATFARSLANVITTLLIRIPLAGVAWLLFPYQLPGDPVVWLAFVITMFLGVAVMFCFDWILSCLTFYTTEVWGVGVLRYGAANFLSGALVPLAMMPDWLRRITEALPFSHAVYTPVSILSGIIPLADLPRIWLVEMGYLVVLIPLSRWVFNRSVRKITVQGG